MAIPYKGKENTKKEQVKDMFDNIASRYDFLNRFLTVGIDKRWRRAVCKIAKQKKPQTILDVASGTGDLAIALSKIAPRQIIGVDISEGMLKIGRKKIEKRGLSSLITLKEGDAEQIKEKDCSFDMVTCAFGVRNFQDLDKGLSEFFRILKEGGNIVILELSIPKNKVFRFFYNAYFKFVLPLWGRIISKDMSAYSYLPESVAEFPPREVFLQKLEDIGFRDAYVKPLTFGIATIFVATK